MAKVKEKDKYRFKQGDTLHLDDIYNISGLAGGDWWEPVPDRGGDIVVITRDVNFTITVYE